MSTEFEDLLERRLRDATADVHLSRPVLPAALAAHRRHRSRRQLVAAGTVAVVGITAGLTLSNASRSSTAAPPTMRTAPAPAPRLVSVNEVLTRASKVLDTIDYHDWVVRVTADSPGLHTVSSMDLQTGQQRLDQKVSLAGTHDDSSDSITADGMLTIVDYAARTWQRYQTPRPDPGDVQDRGLGSPSDSLPDLDTPEGVKHALAAKTVTLAGRDTVEGRSAYRLQCSGVTDGQAESETVWVDANSYLPLRVSYQGLSKTGHGTGTVVMDWLPRTGANLTALELDPPAGFRHLPRPAPKK
jgi:hypothetical protein